MLKLKRLAYEFTTYAKRAELTEDERNKDLIVFMCGAAAALDMMGYSKESEYLTSVVELSYMKQGYKACEQDAKSYESMKD